MYPDTADTTAQCAWTMSISFGLTQRPFQGFRRSYSGFHNKSLLEGSGFTSVSTVKYI